MKLVMIGGMPAGGKTTETQKYVDQGYVRLNRDIEGGKVEDLAPKLDALLRAGKNVVMDNLFATVHGRKRFIDIGHDYNADITFVLMDTSLEDAQFNACSRMMDRVGKILDHKDKTNDPNLFPVAVLYKYRKEFERPTEAEGFSLEVKKFKREYRPEWTKKAFIFDFDGTLRTSSGKEDYPTCVSEVVAKTHLKNKLLSLQNEGYLLLGVSNQSGIAKGTVTLDNAKACFDETLKQLDVKFDAPVEFCPHKVPPISCYCRKPGPGLGVKLIYEHNLDPRKCTYVGDMGTDKSFAARCGFNFMTAEEFERKI